MKLRKFLLGLFLIASAALAQAQGFDHSHAAWHALLAKHVTAVEPVAYPGLGTEAIQRMTLRGFPAFVAIDATGRDLYAEAASQWAGGAR